MPSTNSADRTGGKAESPATSGGVSGGGGGFIKAHDEAGGFTLTFLPWVISIGLHLGVALLAVAAIWSVKTRVEEQEVIIPVARLSETPGRPLVAGPGAMIADAGAGSAKIQSGSLGGGLHQTLPSQDRSSDATGLEGSADPGASGLGQGVMGGDNGVGGAGGDNPFGQGVQGGEGLRANFYGSGGNARKIVYMVNASGSLIGTLPIVIQELKRSVSQLGQEQEFTVLFFRGEDVIEVPPVGLKRATAANKVAAIKWLDPDAGNIVPMGQSNPVRALQAALQYRPNLMFLLSGNITGQGRYEVDQSKLLAKLAEANKGNTKINTYQFVYPDPLVKLGIKGTMQQIAEMTGGVYKFVDARELGIE